MELLILIKNLFNNGKVIVRKEDMYRYYCDTFVGLTPIITYFDTRLIKFRRNFISSANKINILFIL